MKKEADWHQEEHQAGFDEAISYSSTSPGMPLPSVLMTLDVTNNAKWDKLGILAGTAQKVNPVELLITTLEGNKDPIFSY